MNIRHFMNLVEASNEPLLEAQNYGDMLNDVRKIFRSIEGQESFLNGLEAAFTNMLNDTRRSLKKSDRIVSFIRQWKLGFCLVAMTRFTGGTDNNPALHDAVNNLRLRYVAEFKARVPDLETDTLERFCERMYRNHMMVLEQIEHFLSLPIGAIQNKVFGFEPLYKLFNEFRVAEDEWKSKAQQLIPYDPNDGQVIEKFNDGWFWLLLDRASCRAEGAAMGHCGNTASPHKGDRVLSFRKIVDLGGHNYVRPSLTFILQHDGYLGEMKGRANNKPKAEYHPYIIALLKNDLIKGIRGGGYDPRNNFSINDLDDATREALINEKPALGTLLDYYKRVGKVDDHIRSKLNDGGKLTWFEDNEHVVSIENWPSGMNDFVTDHGNRSAKYIIEVFTGEESPDFQGYDDDGAKELLENLEKSTVKKIGDYVASTYPEEIEAWKEDEYEDEFDPTDSDHVAALLQRTDDDIWTDLKSANEDGHRYGAEAEMSKAIKDAIAKYRPILRLSNGDQIAFSLSYDQDENGNLRSWDAPVHLLLAIEDAIKLVSDEAFEDEWGDYVSSFGEADDKEFEVSEPYYGWSDYDEEGAIRSFLDNNPAYAPDKAAPSKTEDKPALDLSGWTVETIRKNDYTGQREVKVRNAEGVQVLHRSGAYGTDEEILADLAKELANR